MADDKPDVGINTVEDFAPELQPALEDALEATAFFHEITKNNDAAVPEPIFREHILPMLANRSGRQDLSKWLDVAGHVMRGLSVYDPETRKFLFRVPPLMRQINREFTGQGRNSAFEILQTADLKRKNLPAGGDAHIRKNLVERVSHTPADAQNVIAWNEILKRYGYPPILSKDYGVENQEGAEEKNDKVEYDTFEDL